MFISSFRASLAMPDRVCRLLLASLPMLIKKVNQKGRASLAWAVIQGETAINVWCDL